MGRVHVGVILVIPGTCVQQVVAKENMAMNAGKSVDIAVMWDSVSIATVRVSPDVVMVSKGNYVKHVATKDVTGLTALEIVETVQT